MKTPKLSLLLVSLLLIQCTRAKLWGILSSEEDDIINNISDSEEKREAEEKARKMEIIKQEAHEEDGSESFPEHSLKKKLKVMPRYRTTTRAHAFVKPFHPFDLKDYSYHVVFSSKTSRSPLCQGALIKPKWVIGSAACFEKYKEFILSFKIVAILGATSFIKKSDKSTEINVVQVYNYPDFDYETGINDLALIKLEHPAVETDFVKRIDLTLDSFPLDVSCKYTTYVGNILYALTVTYVDEEECAKPFLVNSNVTLPFFCARVKDSQLITSRDDILGSPVVCDNQLFGIKASHSIFSSIYNVTDWLYSMTLENEQNDQLEGGHHRGTYGSVEDSSRDRQISQSVTGHKRRKQRKHHAHSPTDSGGDSSEITSREKRTSIPTTSFSAEQKNDTSPNEDAIKA